MTDEEFEKLKEEKENLDLLLVHYEYLIGQPSFEKLPLLKQSHIRIQLFLMRAYSEVLNVRINDEETDRMVELPF